MMDDLYDTSISTRDLDSCFVALYLTNSVERTNDVTLLQENNAVIKYENLDWQSIMDTKS